MKKLLILLILVLAVAGCVGEEPVDEIDSFEDCINAGYPAMESYPRQCMAGNRTFTEEVCFKLDSMESMGLIEAKEIAIESECTENGTLKDTYFCNQDTGTWWLDLDMELEGCSPACVINVETGEAEINWRCTGLLG